MTPPSTLVSTPATPGAVTAGGTSSRTTAQWQQADAAHFLHPHEANQLRHLILYPLQPNHSIQRLEMRLDRAGRLAHF